MANIFSFTSPAGLRGLDVYDVQAGLCFCFYDAAGRGLPRAGKIVLNEDEARQLLQDVYAWLIHRQQLSQAAALENSNG